MVNHRLRALLVEDSRLVAQYLTQLLDIESHQGIDIVHVERLAEAAQALTRQAFDVVLLDLSLPDSAGTSTITRARSLAPGTPIVVLSCDDDDIIRQEAVRMGARAYLVKGDVSAAAIVQTILQAVDLPRTEREAR